MKSQSINAVFLILGLVWVIVGFLLYQNSNIWPLGFLFLLAGLIGSFKQRKKAN